MYNVLYNESVKWRVTVSVNTDGKGFVECRSFGDTKLSGPRFSRSQLVDYLRSSELSQPDVVQMKSTPLRSIQSLLVAVLHDYWLAKYVMHIIAVEWPRAPDDASAERLSSQHCLSAGTLITCCVLKTIQLRILRFSSSLGQGQGHRSRNEI